MQRADYPFDDVECVFCGWDDDGALTLSPVEPDDRHDEDHEQLADEVSVDRCGNPECREPLAHDTVRRKPLPERPKRPIRDRGHRCERAGVRV